MADTNPQPAALDPVDRRLLEAIQQAVPLTPQPFASLADQLHLPETEVLDRLQAIRRQGLISRMSAIFDTRGLGYESVLVAAKVPPERVEHAATAINEHPGVSHNYLRTADYNVWFTLAVPPDSQLGLEKTAATLARLAGATSFRLLPATRVFKIGVKLALSEAEAQTESPAGEPEAGLPAAPSQPARPPGSKPLDLTAAAKAAILALQEDLPIEPRPFDAIAARHGLTVEQVLAAGRDLQAAGLIRRYAAVLRHRKIGFAVNCMTVWSVPPDRTEQAAAALAAFPEVTHCYERPAFPDWPYNLYAMVHCRDDQQCRDLVARMKAAAGIGDMLEVYSTREFKKVRLEYFSPAFGEWEGRNASSAGGPKSHSAWTPVLLSRRCVSFMAQSLVASEERGSSFASHTQRQVKYPQRVVTVIRELLTESVLPRDALPYTEEFEVLKKKFGSRVGLQMTDAEFWQALANVGKWGGVAGKAGASNRFECRHSQANKSWRSCVYCLTVPATETSCPTHRNWTTCTTASSN